VVFDFYTVRPVMTGPRNLDMPNVTPGVGTLLYTRFYTLN
jgi:hypothetical protein